MVRAGVVYVLVGLGVIEAADLLFPRLGLPEWTVQLVVGLAIVGLPLTLALAWAFEWTSEGLRPETPADPSGSTATAEATPAPSAPAARDTLLVLPFTNLSPDPGNEYFSDGLTEEIIASLSRIRSLGVISRTSAMRLKHVDESVRELGRRLAVRYVLEGSVRKDGPDVRITAQLVDAVNDQHLWAETYTGSVDDVFEIQERVGAAIASALQLQLSPAEAKAMRSRGIGDPVAHESYLRARHELFSFSAEGLERARRHVQNALDVVGENEVLLATMGTIEVWCLQVGVDGDARHLERADACAESILRIAPDSHESERLRGLIAFQRGDLRGARGPLQAALRRVPSDPDALATLGYVYCLAGREELGLEYFERLLAVDPLTPLNHGMPGFVAALQGRFDDMVKPYGTFLRMDGGGPFSTMNWIWALGLAGRIDEAEPHVERLEAAHAGTPMAAVGMSLYHGLLGDRTRALAALGPSLEAAAEHTEMFSRFLTQCLAVAGDTDRALDRLDHTVDLGLAHYPFIARIDPLLENLRDRPRFHAILERVEREWRSFGEGDGPGVGPPRR